MTYEPRPHTIGFDLKARCTRHKRFDLWSDYVQAADAFDAAQASFSSRGVKLAMDRLYDLEQVIRKLDAKRVMRFQRGGYAFWQDAAGLWNVSTDPDSPPSHFAYASAEAIAKLKGVKL
jgi:hypothetical protein